MNHWAHMVFFKIFIDNQIRIH